MKFFICHCYHLVAFCAIMQIWLQNADLKGQIGLKSKLIYLRQLHYGSNFQILIKHHGVISINVDENDKTPLLFYEFVTQGGDSHENSFRVKCLRRMSGSYSVISESIKSNLNDIDYHKRLLNGSNGLLL